MNTDWVYPVALVTVMFYLVTRIRYAVDERHVRVKLFGATFRKIALTDIEFADTAGPFWSEHWCNTFWACGRVVRLHRKSGLFRNFIITPANREAFLTELRAKLPR